MTQIALDAPAFLTWAAVAARRALAGLRGFADGAAAGLRARAEVGRVDRLTDRELTELGLTREVAIRGAFERAFG